LLCLIWGSTWLAIKLGLEGVPPFLGAGLRFVLAAWLLGLALLVRNQPLRLTRDDKVCILSLGILVFWLDYGGIYWAETRISSGLTAILFSTMPLMTALLSHFWTHSERLTGRKLAGILISVAGTALLFWPREDFGRAQVPGILAVLGATLCAAINLVVAKQHGAHSNPLVLNFIGMALGACCLLGTSAALETWSSVVWTRSNLVALVYLSVFGSVIAFLAFYRLLKVMDATIVSTSTLIFPVVALVLGRVFLNETVTLTAVTGSATILIGVAVALYRAPRTYTPAYSRPFGLV
jgi:drug/metabolite transporter (DMT)-like permease